MHIIKLSSYTGRLGSVGRGSSACIPSFMKIAVRKILVSEMETVSKGEYNEVAQTYRENVGKAKGE